MSNVIDFLERMGADATLRAAGTDALARELAASAVDASLAAAILAGDDAALRDRLAPGTYYAIQLEELPAKEEQPDDEEESSVRFAKHRA